MTARDVYEAVLMELNKVHAPALTVEEFVYFLNKAILAFTNERYNFYAVNQQLSDDLRVLLTPFSGTITTPNIISDVDGSRYIQYTIADSNYFHLISCDLIVRNKISNRQKKYTVKALTLDMLGAIHDNEYLKPALHRPHFLLLPVSGIAQQDNSIIKVFIGDDVANIVPSAVKGYYLRLPEIATLTDDQVYNLVIDNSQTLEFPNYLKNEFVKRVSWYQLEATRDQRLGTHASLNQEIPTMPIEYGASQQAPQIPTQE